MCGRFSFRVTAWLWRGSLFASNLLFEAQATSPWSEATRSTVLDHTVSVMDGLARGPHHRSARNAGLLASRGISIVLALAIALTELRTPQSRGTDSAAHSSHAERKPELGSASYPRRIASVGVYDIGAYRIALLTQSETCSKLRESETVVSISQQPPRSDRGVRLLHCSKRGLPHVILLFCDRAQSKTDPSFQRDTASGQRVDCAATARSISFPQPLPQRLVRPRCEVRRRCLSVSQVKRSQANANQMQSPWQNGIAERFVGSIRRELLDHVIPLNEYHLRRLARDYLAYYHPDRTHVGWTKRPRPSASWNRAVMSKLKSWQSLEWVDCIIDTLGPRRRDHRWRVTIAVRPTSRCVQTIT